MNKEKNTQLTHDLYDDRREPVAKKIANVYVVQTPLLDGELIRMVDVRLTVESNGILIIESGKWLGVSVMHEAQKREVVEWLTQWELATLAQVDVEDWELFATINLDPTFGIVP